MKNLLVVMVIALGAAIQVGCSCGLAVDPAQPNDAGIVGSANITDGGVVTFPAVEVGASETFRIPVKDTADTDETITGAKLGGTDAAAFQILSTFPIAVPAGEPAMVEVEFTPVKDGPAAAELILQTAAMGASTIALAGVGQN